MDTKKAVTIIAIVLSLSVMAPYLPSYAQPSYSSIGIIISSTINGVHIALHSVKPGTEAYQQLNVSLAYLNTAQKLYNEGNYTGAEYYVRLAMNSSYTGVIVAGGNPFAVPPGLNASREIALNYAEKLEALAQNVSNSSVREQVMSNISTAVSELQLSGNASQIAHYLTQSRTMLGNANSIIHQYSKVKFSEKFEHDFAPKMLKTMSGLNSNVAQAFNASVTQKGKSFQFENASLIAKDMEDFQEDYFKASLILPAGSIGVYGNIVYMNLSYPLPVVQIDGELYTSSAWIISNSIISMPANSTSIIGIINSTAAYGFVISNSGSQVTVFPPSHDGVARVHVVLNDVGMLTMKPTNSTMVYYTSIPSKIHDMNDDQEFNISGFYSSINRTVVMSQHGHEFEFENSSVEISFNGHGHVKIEFNNGTEISINGANINFTNMSSFMMGNNETNGKSTMQGNASFYGQNDYGN